ncbi:MAG: 16S rRNA (uracil(1498)-N(3))-methyltransferase [Pseudomonadales bacterium]|nr:16S rRNA (uracil(1498)-N(3))-methyltransferase [Pseudomonadales bacterium]MCP5330267.1 16S rRNA (uracil(1498)-N(3))-methyltransferase [Pseudomonadales bacterium]MCP5344117.1 16S rRNA (uracil(1498)-N(3))-methyltransferase [Pseudomonadales bacterium]
MRLSRIHTTHALAEGNTLPLNDDTAHYLGKVLRVRPGDTLSLFNAEHGEFLASIVSVDKKHVTVQLGERIPCAADPSLPIHLGLGLSRGERMDYAIQKATEAGVSGITPLLTQRCEVKLRNERMETRLQHWQRIAISASEQCGRCAVPVIHAPETLESWLQRTHEGLRFVLDHRATRALSGHEDAPASITLLIGPEGGLSEDEVEQANTAGFHSLRLGPRVLRTETAPVIAIALLQQRWGDY